MKKNIFSLLCLILGLVIGLGAYLIYDLATDGKGDKAPQDTVTAAPLPGKNNREILAYSYDVLEVLRTRDYNALSELVHPEYGVYFSPYSTINPSSNQWFTTYDVAQLGSREEALVWGVFDGSGEPISLTVEEYFSRFVYDRDYTSAPVVSIDRVAKAGNSLENTAEIFPEGHFVDFLFPGQSAEVPDWSLLRLVYEEYEGTLRLVAIAHSQPTV